MRIAMVCSVLVASALVRPPVQRLLSRARVSPAFVGGWVSRVPGVVPIGEVVPGATAKVAGVVRRIHVPGSGLRRLDALVSDPTGEIWLVCTAEPFPRFTTGTAIVADGLVEGEPGSLRIVNPRIFDEDVEPIG